MILIVFVLIGGAFLVAAIASFFVRRHGESAAPEPGWTSTAEVFRDPSTDRLMRVWVDQAGGRHYVPESGGR
jgi:hypothetical protein